VLFHVLVFYEFEVAAVFIFPKLRALLLLREVGLGSWSWQQLASTGELLWFWQLVNFYWQALEQLPIGWQHPLPLGWEEEKSTHRKAIFDFWRKHLGGLGPRTAGLG